MQCPACNYVLSDLDGKCPHCGAARPETAAAATASPAAFDPNRMSGPVPFTPHAQGPHAEGDSTGGVIPYKNPNALIAYYLAVASLIPCFGIVTGVIAVFLGIKGLRYANEKPVVKGKVHAWIGIIGGGLLGGGQLLFVLLIALSMIFGGR